jgi:RNA recognition motif-containing protein
MSKKLFVGGLAWATSSEGLRAAFEKFGEITDAIVLTDRETGRSRGFGFVTFKEDSAADAGHGRNERPADRRPRHQG